MMNKLINPTFKAAFALVVMLFAANVFGVKAQNFNINLKGNVLTPKAGVSGFFEQKENWKQSLFNGNYYVLLQFEKLPTNEQKAELTANGIVLGDYIPNNTYYATIPATATAGQFAAASVRSIVAIPPASKVESVLNTKLVPRHVTKVAGMYDVNIQFFGNSGSADVQSEVIRLGGQILGMSPVLSLGTIRIPSDKIAELSSFPLIKYILPVHAPIETNNVFSRGLHRDNVLQSNLLGQRGLTGDSVRVNITDVGDILHEDFLKRANHETTEPVADHSTHCSGTIAGAGLIDPNALGMAPKASLYAWSFFGDVTDTLLYYTPIFNYTVTSNSWGYGPGYYGDYDYLSYEVDSEALLYEDVSQCQSAGNQGPNFGTVSTGPGSSKNNITVGALYRDEIAGFSSRGPTNSGRLKPEVCANGVNVYSSVPGNGYDFYSGTSMACPGTAGTIALIQQRYRQLNSGATPPNYLVKALLMNTAQDLGNAGPDYIYGFGRIDGLKCVEAIEQSRYVMDKVSHNDTFRMNFKLPIALIGGKLMLNWNDMTPSFTSSNLLVNNLDLMLVTPNGTLKPWVLDPNNPSNLAVSGVDTINSEEQITMDTMPAGNYTIMVIGTNVPFGPQKFALTWEAETTNIKLTSPLGGESFAPLRPGLDAGANFYEYNNEMSINWTSAGTTANTDIYFSADNGGSWSQIGSVTADKRDFYWEIPDTISDQCLIRVSDGTYTSESQTTFTILQNPTISNILGCDKKVVLNWNPIAGAVAYDILRLKNDSSWDFVNFTTDTFYIDSTVSSNETYWYSLTAMTKGGGMSNRCIAMQVSTSSSNICVADDDAGIVSIDSPAQGFCSGLIPVYASIRNFGLNTLTSALIDWDVNGSSQGTIKWTGKIGLGGTEMVYLGDVKMVSGTTYDIKVYTSDPNGTTDGNNANDTAWRSVQEGLDGTYTIGGKKADYKTIGDAVADVNNRGVCGPVVFNIFDGSYTEQLQLNSIRGGSSSNTVTFQSQSGDSSKVNWNYPNNSSDNWIFHLNGASNVILNQITLERTGSSTAGSRLLTLSSTTDVAVTNCAFIGVWAKSTGIYDQDGNNNSLLISNNNLRLSNYGIYLSGIGAYENNNMIINNTLDSNALRGIFAVGQINFTIKGNTVLHLGALNYGNEVNAFDLQYCDSMLFVSNNKIVCHEPGVSILGMNLYNCSGTAKSANVIYNNFVSVAADSSSYAVGFMHNNASYQYIFFNNVNVYGTDYSYPYYTYSATMNHNIVGNNNFVGQGAYASPVSGASSSFYDIFDYNNLYATSGMVANFDGVDYSDIDTFIKYTGQTKSLSANPGYVDDSDLHVTSIDIYRKGISTDVTEDIDGEKRDTATTIGADEIYFPDAGITSIYNPDTAICPGSMDVWVTLKNWGAEDLNKVEINWTMNGNTQATVNWKGTLTTNSTDSVNLGAFNFKAGTSVVVKVWTGKPNSKQDGYAGNDTSWKTINVSKLPQPGVVGSTTVCASSLESYYTSGNSGSKYNWTVSNGTVTSGSGTDSITVTWSGSSIGSVKVVETNSTGCSDSSEISITINPIPKATTIKDSSICNGSSIDIGAPAVANHVYSWTSNPTGFTSTSSNPSVNPTVSTVYYLTETDTISGCDNMDSVAVTVNYANGSIITTAACDAYAFKGNLITQSGTYYDTLSNMHGCDSIITLNLTINLSDSSTTSFTTCDSFMFRGAYLTSSGTYYDTLKTVNGCDSFITLNLTINKSMNTVLNVSSCNSYIFKGDTLYQSGVYYDSLKASTGCDSITTLNLTIGAPDTVSVKASSCDSYTFGGNILTASGTYYDTLSNQTGCDSFITLNLTINKSYMMNNYVSACNSYVYNGDTLKTSGMYMDTFTNVTGCDSIIMLNLTISQPNSSSITTSACNSYVFGSKTITASGTYMDTFTNQGGCDSVVTLNLTVLKGSSSTLTVSSCSDYVFGGKTLTTSGTYYDTLSNKAGCDSIITLNLTVTKLNTAVTLNIKTLNATETGATYQWLDCDNGMAKVTGATSQSFIVTKTGTTHYAVALSKGGCMDTSACTEVIVAGIDENTSSTQIRIYPNPTKGLVHLTIQSPSTETIRINVTDVLGKTVYTSNLEKTSNSIETEFNLGGNAAGVYMIECISKEGVEIRRLVVE